MTRRFVQKNSETPVLVSFSIDFCLTPGGTGSGLGTRLCCALREAFPEAVLAAQLVWPFRRGEVSIQAYNAVLSLSHLQASTDGLFLFENDVLHDICQCRLGISNVAIRQLNQLIGHQVIWPMTNLFLYLRARKDIWMPR